MCHISVGRDMALPTLDSHRLAHGRGPVGAVGVIVCCASLPQSQGNNSKNSVVSSSSTKDSNMSSSAPMVPHLYLLSLTLLFFTASFHCLHLQRSVRSPPSFCVTPTCPGTSLFLLCPLSLSASCSASLLKFWTQTVMSDVDLMTLKLNDLFVA